MGFESDLKIHFVGCKFASGNARIRGGHEKWWSLDVCSLQGRVVDGFALRLQNIWSESIVSTDIETVYQDQKIRQRYAKMIQIYVEYRFI